MLAKNPPATISVQQAFSLRDPGIQGPMWVSKVTVPAPQEDHALKQLLASIDAVKKTDAIYDIPSLESVHAEWTGFRKGANDKTKHMAHLPESELYARMMQDTTSDATILYMHGGALYLMVTHITLIDE